MAANQKHIVVSHKNVLVRRVVTAKNLDELVGVPGVHKDDLVWEEGHPKPVDITNHDEAVVEYFRKDSDFTVREVEVPKSS